MFYTGIDQHKRNSYITTYGPAGNIVKQERVPNTQLGLRQYFAQFHGPHRAVVESTGGWDRFSKERLVGLNGIDQMSPKWCLDTTAVVTPRRYYRPTPHAE